MDPHILNKSNNIITILLQFNLSVKSTVKFFQEYQSDLIFQQFHLEVCQHIETEKFLNETPKKALLQTQSFNLGGSDQEDCQWTINLNKT